MVVVVVVEEEEEEDTEYVSKFMGDQFRRKTENGVEHVRIFLAGQTLN